MFRKVRPRGISMKSFHIEASVRTYCNSSSDLGMISTWKPIWILSYGHWCWECVRKCVEWWVRKIYPYSSWVIFVQILRHHTICSVCKMRSAWKLSIFLKFHRVMEHVEQKFSSSQFLFFSNSGKVKDCRLVFFSTRLLQTLLTLLNSVFTYL